MLAWLKILGVFPPFAVSTGMAVIINHRPSTNQQRSTTTVSSQWDTPRLYLQRFFSHLSPAAKLNVVSLKNSSQVELFCAQTPKTCKNFLALAASGATKLKRFPSFFQLAVVVPGYYDNTNFHRNIKGFMIQAEDQFFLLLFVFLSFFRYGYASCR